MKLVKFFDKTWREDHYGVLRNDSKDIICGCCGNILTPDEYEIIYSMDYDFGEDIKRIMEM